MKYNTLDNVQESFSDVLWREINMLASMLRLKSEFHKGSSHFTWLNHHGNICYMQPIQASTKFSWFFFKFKISCKCNIDYLLKEDALHMQPYLTE